MLTKHLVIMVSVNNLVIQFQLKNLHYSHKKLMWLSGKLFIFVINRKINNEFCIKFLNLKYKKKIF